jgi:SAM-dependent methyltransferase
MENMGLGADKTCEWTGYLNTDFTFKDFPPQSRVLDIGFGAGLEMRRLTAAGCRSIGLDLDPDLVREGRASGLAVCRGVAEALPFATAGFDGVVCKVVMPYTDEAKAVAEIARVLRPGGIARVSYHGLGYSLRYLFTDRNWKLRVYGARTIANTAVYAVTGRRLYGFWGDTLFQSDRRLRHYYGRVGLQLVEAAPSPRFAGAPVFIYHVLRRTRT